MTLHIPVPAYRKTKDLSMPPQIAAWLPARHARLEVGPAPRPSPRELEIVVENRAVAVNPLDWIKQLLGDLMFGFIRYPFVMGSDLAGVVVEVGSAVTRFRVGDRVLAHAVGMDPDRNSAAEGAFQNYTVALERMASPIPDWMPFERAAVLPLGLSTAACALFQQDHLALQAPSLSPMPTGKTLLVWGGSTSVGCNAIQLAVAAGYEVFTTASPRNFALVEKLGACKAFDYRSPTVVQDLVTALQGKTLAGALAIGAGSAEAVIDIVSASTGNRFISMASPSASFDAVPHGPGWALALARVMAQIVWGGAITWMKCRMRGVQSKFVFGTTLINNDVSRMVYADFLPEALAQRRYVAAPEPEVIGKGLECLQHGLDLQKKGVSAKKIVVLL